ncbi:hypothetical protein ACEF99_005533 [Salmonella enterica subsp. enterica serovar Newport]
MLTALKGRGYSIRYHQTILKEYIRQRSVVFLPGSKLLSRRIVHTHHFPGSFQMKIFYRAMPTDRTGISVKHASPVAGNQTIQQIPGSSGETQPVSLPMRPPSPFVLPVHRSLAVGMP